MSLVPMRFRLQGLPLLLWVAMLLGFGLFSVGRRALQPSMPLPAPMFTVPALTVQAPATLEAGNSALIQVLAPGVQPTSSDLSVRLVLIGTFGSTVLERPLIDGVAHFTLGASTTRFAGALQLQATLGDRVAQTTVQIRPGPPVEPLLALVGPRSIPADGAHWTMVVTLPQDRFANGVATGTSVTIEALHPSSSQERTTTAGNRVVSEVKVAHLLSWAQIRSRTKAGPIYLAAHTPMAHSMGLRIVGVPGLPAPFTIQAEPLQLTADGNQLVRVYTSLVADRFGNQLLDGTAVTFVVEAQGGERRTLPAQLIKGTATVPIQAPASAGPLTVSAFVRDQPSPPLLLDFGAGLALTPFTVTVTVGSETVDIRAGPLLGVLNQYVPDGTIVRFLIKHAADPIQRLTAESERGFATATLRRNGLAAGRYHAQVQVGDQSAERDFSLPANPP